MALTTYIKEKYIRDLFDVSVIIKGIDGALQVIGGVSLIFLNPDTVKKIIDLTTLHHNHFTVASEKFGIIFLLSHGLVKIIIVVSLLRQKLWAYPVAITVFTAFGIYQIYRYFHTHSVGLIILTVLDVIVIFLTWHEWNVLSKHISEHD